jgi:glycosyltransferase involved in cell wall biosynthesis
MAAVKPKILLLAAASATSGGGEKHVADLIERLPAAGIDVALACPEGGDLPRLAKERKVVHYPVDIVAGISAGKLGSVKAAIEAAQPDIVHAHGSRAALFARLADPRARARCVYTVHGIHIDKSGSALRRTAFLALERSLRGKTAHFVTVCHSDIEKGQRLGVLDASRASVVYNGIELPAANPQRDRFRMELGLAEDSPLVLNVGRFHQQKDHATLLRAWRTVAAENPTATLAIIGSGELAGQLRESVVSLGIASSVRFVEPRAGLASAYADADVFALSSLWEGLPYVVLEAMANRVPVVSTAVDGVPEAVLEGKTGFLVPPGDSAALAGALSRLLAEPVAREEMGESGRRLVAEKFSLDAMVKGLLGVYGEVAGA